MATKRPTSFDHISFRITNPAVAALLEERAEALGASPNLVARQLLTEALTRQDELASRVALLQQKTNELLVLFHKLDALQGYLERGLYLILRHGGNLDAGQATAALERCFASTLSPREGPSDADREKDGAGK